MKWAITIRISFRRASKRAVRAAEEEIEEVGLHWYSSDTCFFGHGSRKIQWRFGSRKAAETAANPIKETLLWHGVDHEFSLEKI